MLSEPTARANMILVGGGGGSTLLPPSQDKTRVTAHSHQKTVTYSDQTTVACSDPSAEVHKSSLNTHPPTAEKKYTAKTRGNQHRQRRGGGGGGVHTSALQLISEGLSRHARNAPHLDSCDGTSWCAIQLIANTLRAGGGGGVASSQDRKSRLRKLPPVA